MKEGGEELLSSVVSEKSSTLGKAVKPGLAAAGMDSMSARKEARMKLIDPKYQQYYNYAMSELVHPDQYKKMDAVKRKEIEKQAKHTALQALYGKGITTRQMAAAIETDRRARAASELASTDLEAKKVLTEDLGIQANEEMGGLDERSALQAMNADFNGETLEEKLQELHDKKYRKKHVVDAHIQDANGEEESFVRSFGKKFLA